MKIHYSNIHGCQNEYGFLDLVKEPLDLVEKDFPSLAREIAQKEASDGMILLMPPAEPHKADCRMRIFNADGSEAEMCGNGIRGLSLLFDKNHGPKDEIRVETIAGIRECKILDRSESKYDVQVNMGRPTFIPSLIPVIFEDVMVINEEFEVLGKSFMVSCVNIGNPHCVVDVRDVDEIDVAKYGPAIEKNEAFPEGVNVEFVENKNGVIRQRTWERGSGETKACGTGATAAGITLIMRSKVDSPVDIQLRGGMLRVEWDGLREAYLTGPAEIRSTSTLDWGQVT